MKATHRIQDHLCEEFERVQGLRRGSIPPWLESLQFSSLAEFSNLGFPGSRSEAWKYTRLDKWIDKPFRVWDCPPGVLHAERVQSLVGGYPGPVLVFEQGFFRPDLSSAPGVTFCSLAEAIAGGDPDVRSLLQAPGSLTRNFHALNDAMLQDGLFLRLGSRQTIPEPLMVVFYQSALDAPVASYPRVLVQLDTESQLELVEIHAGDAGAENFSSGVTTARLAPGARLTYSRLQQEPDTNLHIAQLQIDQQAGSLGQLRLASLGAGLSRQEVAVNLEGEGAEYGLSVATHGRDRQHHDFFARINHRAINCRGETLWKGVADGRSRSVFTGHIQVEPGADGTDAQLKTASLLLSDQAEVDAKPVLEIYADDVKCSHGATVGQIDREQLFYLVSRGVPEAVARALLVGAFTGEVIDRFSPPVLREQIESVFADRLRERSGL